MVYTDRIIGAPIETVWQEGRDYFAKTWPEVMARYSNYVENTGAATAR